MSRLPTIAVVLATSLLSTSLAAQASMSGGGSRSDTSTVRGDAAHDIQASVKDPPAAATQAAVPTKKQQGALGSIMNVPQQTFTSTANPASVAAPATPGQAWMCVGIIAYVSGASTAGNLAQLFDGSNAGTLLATWDLTVPGENAIWNAPAGTQDALSKGLPYGFVGTPGNAMTLQTNGAAGSAQGVTLIVIPIPGR